MQQTFTWIQMNFDWIQEKVMIKFWNSDIDFKERN